MIGQILFFGEAHLFHFIAEFGGYDGCRVDVQRLVDGRHDAEVEQHLDDFIGLQAHLVSHVGHPDGFFDADLALDGLEGLGGLRNNAAGLGPSASASARHIIHIIAAAAPVVRGVLKIDGTAGGLVAFFLALAVTVRERAAGRGTGSEVSGSSAAGRARALIAGAGRAVVVTPLSGAPITRLSGASVPCLTVASGIAVVAPVGLGGLLRTCGGYGRGVGAGNNTDLRRGRFLGTARLATVAAIVVLAIGRAGTVAFGDRRQQRRRGGAFGPRGGGGLRLAGLFGFFSFLCGGSGFGGSLRGSGGCFGGGLCSGFLSGLCGGDVLRTADHLGDRGGFTQPGALFLPVVARLARLLVVGLVGFGNRSGLFLGAFLHRFLHGNFRSGRRFGFRRGDGRGVLCLGRAGHADNAGRGRVVFTRGPAFRAGRFFAFGRNVLGGLAAATDNDAGLYFAAVALFGRGGVFQMVLHAIDVLRSNVAGSAFRRNIQLTQRLQKILGRYAKFCRKVFHLGLVFSHALISLTLPPACAEPPEFFPAGRFRAYIPAASGLGLALIDQKFPPLRGQNVAHELLFGHAPSAYGAHPGGHMPPVHAIRLPRPPFRRPCPHRHRPCQPIRPLRERGS